MVSVSFSKKDFKWAVPLVLVLVIGFGIAVSPDIMGHSLDEVAMPACATNEFLQKTASGWGCGSIVATGGGETIMAVHSQSTSAASCPSGWTELWDGYSLVGGFVSAGYRGTNDLGKSGSCSETFRPIPVIECGNPTQCDYYTGGDYGMWLSAVSSDKGGSNAATTRDNYVSKCAVCKKSASVLVRHSMSTTVPSCPSGMTSLWSGYSLFGTTISGSLDAPQDLSSPGSCMKTFRPVPIVECSNVNSCDYFTGGDYGIWLSVKSTDQGNINGIATLRDNHISRCRVCEY